MHKQFKMKTQRSRVAFSFILGLIFLGPWIPGSSWTSVPGSWNLFGSCDLGIYLDLGSWFLVLPWAIA